MPKSTPFFKNKFLNFLASNLLGYSILSLILIIPAPVTGKWVNPFESKENFKIHLQITALIYAAIMSFVYLRDKAKKKANKT